MDCCAGTFVGDQIKHRQNGASEAANFPEKPVGDPDLDLATFRLLGGRGVRKRRAEQVPRPPPLLQVANNSQYQRVIESLQGVQAFVSNLSVPSSCLSAPWAPCHE
jgi:hypothetical protein